MKSSPIEQFHIDQALVQIYPSSLELGIAAAVQAASIIEDAIRRRGKARIVVGTGNSQEGLVNTLVEENTVDWKHVEVFHMDEYIGISEDHPASFRHWLRTRLSAKVEPGQVHYIRGDAADSEIEGRRYARIVRSEPIDVSFVGFGENGHIAFNEPHTADPQDAFDVKRIVLDDKSREQQVREGHFPHIEFVPREALTLTCPVLLDSKELICCVPERRKAQAVRQALEDTISTECPASLVRSHPRAFIYLDLDSASLLKSHQTRQGL